MTLFIFSLDSLVKLTVKEVRNEENDQEFGEG